MQAYPLQDARLKATWARQTVQKLDAIVKAFLDNDPYSLVNRGDGEGGINVVVAIKPLPIDLLKLSSEYFHHARSALDQLTVSLAVRNGATSLKGVKFPFASSEADFLSTSVPSRK
ncbi:MAG: hypothetical protein WAN59_12755 [Candidatus Baltobacteraceae bacterium]